MQVSTVTRSGKSWQITYTYDLGSGKRKTRNFVVNQTYKPTRSAAMRYAKDDLCSNAMLGHSRGQYGYKNVRITAIDLFAHTILNTTKQAHGVKPTIMQVPTTAGEGADFT
jgi:hypothetical protein